MTKKYTIGIDLGGTNIAGGIVDGDYNIIRKLSIPTNAESDAAVRDGIVSVILSLIKEEGISLSDISHIGVGAPGIVDGKNGIIDYVCNLPLNYYPLAAEIAKNIHYPEKDITLKNDADAAALGEMAAGSGGGAENFMMVTLGTGVGGGVIVDGKILPSFNHAGGELGHTVIVANGAPCGCGRRGCAEAYASATALCRIAKEEADKLLSEGCRSVLFDRTINGANVFSAAELGDEAAKNALNAYFFYVATMLANFINIFQPEVLAIGGGISGAGDSLLLPLEKLIFPDMIYNRNQPKELHTKLKLATLGGDAGIIGAAIRN